MQAAIKRMGNSAAILPPKPVLAHLHVVAGDILQMDLQESRVVLSPAQLHPREGWAEAARSLVVAVGGNTEWPKLVNADDKDWAW